MLPSLLSVASNARAWAMSVVTSVVVVILPGLAVPPVPPLPPVFTVPPVPVCPALPPVPVDPPPPHAAADSAPTSASAVSPHRVGTFTLFHLLMSPPRSIVRLRPSRHSGCIPVALSFATPGAARA
ncbi:MAG: hypothetical protein QM820_59755 [Minicystis sp.]